MLCKHSCYGFKSIDSWCLGAWYFPLEFALLFVEHVLFEISDGNTYDILYEDIDLKIIFDNSILHFCI